MTPEVWRLSLAAALVGVVATGCGEEEEDAPFNIEDEGGNLCGCTATNESRACQALSTGLEAPVWP